MIAVILANAVLSALVVAVIVGSLAYNIDVSTPLRIRRRVVRDTASRLSPRPAAQQSIPRV
ncbi:MAG TPA: hypothetical protein VMA77_08110 [Solirubrobacteraceae bacterium]|nr:hypothetical protein [Solirubrobacteraceae bacterium]